MSAREQRRWLLALGTPFVPAAACFGLALTTTPWLFAGAVLLVPVWIGVLACLALSSDENVEPARVETLPFRGADHAVERRAA